MEGYILRIQKLWKTRTTRVTLLVVVAVVFFVVGFQNMAISSSSSTSSYRSPIVAEDNGGSSKEPSFFRNATTPAEKTEESDDNDDDDDDLDSGEEEEEDGNGQNPDEGFMFEVGDGIVLRKEKDGHLVLVEKTKTDENFEQEQILKNVSSSSSSFVNISKPNSSPSESRIHVPDVNPTPPQISNSTSSGTGDHEQRKKKKKNRKEPFLGVMSISDMDQVLIENRKSASESSMKPLWHSKVDQEMQYAREQIEKAPPFPENNDRELYGPVFRNLTTFIRSYELMEKMLKVYVYREGARPIFHTPFLTGIYASEGWFMKQMENNKQFVVDDPAKAHLFYMPFSSRILQERLYVANSHSHKNLIEHLKSYVATISSAYPFWNRTSGADHFLAGCHDWATHETGRAMGSTIRAVCNADVREGFEIGKDVSLPETNVGNSRDPQQSVGGKPSHLRTTLAFFAGQMHGYLRPVLIQHWGDGAHPDMAISGPIPHRTKERRPETEREARMKNNKKKKKRKKTKWLTVTRYPYRERMKESKYCVCPRGYEVNSPRVVEAIFYGCVPVIVSDNFVPPFFEVLDWSAFAVVLPEKDVPRLREVLLGIGPRRYLELEKGVRGVRRHFLWNHPAPVKYDLFHMILHNVWLNRLYRITS